MIDIFVQVDYLMIQNKKHRAVYGSMFFCNYFLR